MVEHKCLQQLSTEPWEKFPSGTGICFAAGRWKNFGA